MIDLLPIELIVEIINYLLPHIKDIDSNINKIKESNKNLLNLAKVNYLLKEIAYEHGFKIIYFYKDIYLNVIIRYKTKHIIAPFDNNLSDEDLSLLSNQKIETLFVDNNDIIKSLPENIKFKNKASIQLKLWYDILYKCKNTFFD